MIYSLKFVYHDNKDLVINIAAEKLQNFFTALNGKQMYFDDINQMGFWTDLDKIRYVQAFQVQGDKDEQQAPQGSPDISAENQAIA
jgi:hypothetical protein